MLKTFGTVSADLNEAHCLQGTIKKALKRKKEQSPLPRPRWIVCKFWSIVENSLVVGNDQDLSITYQLLTGWKEFENRAKARTFFWTPTPTYDSSGIRHIEIWQWFTITRWLWFLITRWLWFLITRWLWFLITRWLWFLITRWLWFLITRWPWFLITRWLWFLITRWLWFLITRWWFLITERFLITRWL